MTQNVSNINHFNHLLSFIDVNNEGSPHELMNSIFISS